MTGRQNEAASHDSPVPGRAGEATLAVSSSTGIMTVGVGFGSALVAEMVIEAERRHAEELGPALERVTTEAGIGLGDLERLVVDVGPGRFTGLRVGLATVRALSFALDVPVVGLTSLEILAAAGSATGIDSSTPVTAVVDARRREVFQQTFVDGEPDGEAVVGSADELAAQAKGLVVGDGVDRYPDPYRDRSRVEPDLRVVTGLVPTVAAMLALAQHRKPVIGTEVNPFYLRDPDVNPNVTLRPRAGVDG